MSNFTERFGVHFVLDYKALAYAHTTVETKRLRNCLHRHCHALVREKTFNTSRSWRSLQGSLSKYVDSPFVFFFSFSPTAKP